MCLAVPGQVVEWLERESPFSQAVVVFGGVRRQVNMACVPEANVGDYVLVHAGVAITLVDAEEAGRLLRALESMDELAQEGELGSDEIPG